MLITIDMRKYYIQLTLYSIFCILYTILNIGVGSDTDLGDVERAIRDLAIKGYGYSPDLLDEQLNNVSLIRTQERYKSFTPVLRGVNAKKVQKVLIEKFSDIKKKAWDDYINHRLPWQNINHDGVTITGPLTTKGTNPITIIPSTTTTTQAPPPPPNVDKYPVLKDDNALKPIVDKISGLRNTVKDELNKCKDQNCAGNKTPSAPWMSAVNELNKLWDITISDASSLSSAIADAAKNVSGADKSEFESSLKEAIRLKASGNNYAEMKTVNDQISGQSFMNDQEKECTKLHNRWRAIMGLKPLSAEEKKVIAARKHSEYMKQKGQIGHSEDVPGRETPPARCQAEGTSCIGENVAAPFPDPKQVVDKWITSAVHHINIIGSHLRIGIGFVDSYWTVVFGQ